MVLAWLFGWVSFAQLDNTENPFTNPEDAGTADQVWLVWTDEGQGDSLVNVIKWFINWTLGVLALIALIILLRGGFQMVTAAGDEEKYKSWWTILKQAAIGLVVIWLAWFIVSIVFWLINLTTVRAEQWPNDSTIN
jgi:hypothetical protein